MVLKRLTNDGELWRTIQLNAYTGVTHADIKGNEIAITCKRECMGSGLAIRDFQNQQRGTSKNP